MRNHSRRRTPSTVNPQSPCWPYLLRKHRLTGTTLDDSIKPFVGREHTPARNKGVVYFLNDATTGFMSPWELAGVQDPHPPRLQPKPPPSTSANQMSSKSSTSSNQDSKPNEGRGARRKSQSAAAIAAAETEDFISSNKSTTNKKSNNQNKKSFNKNHLIIKIPSEYNKNKSRKSINSLGPDISYPLSPAESENEDQNRCRKQPSRQRYANEENADEIDDIKDVDNEEDEIVHPRAAWPSSLAASFPRSSKSPQPLNENEGGILSPPSLAQSEHEDEDDFHISMLTTTTDLSKSTNDLQISDNDQKQSSSQSQNSEDDKPNMEVVKNVNARNFTGTENLSSLERELNELSQLSNEVECVESKQSCNLATPPTSPKITSRKRQQQHQQQQQQQQQQDMVDINSDLSSLLGPEHVELDELESEWSGITVRHERNRHNSHYKLDNKMSPRLTLSLDVVESVRAAARNNHYHLDDNTNNNRNNNDNDDNHTPKRRSMRFSSKSTPLKTLR